MKSLVLVLAGIAPLASGIAAGLAIRWGYVDPRHFWWLVLACACVTVPPHLWLAGVFRGFFPRKENA
jgi:hypothetical protein